MGHVNLPASKRNSRQYSLLDIVTAAFFGAVILFFLLVFTPLGDSLAASGRQSLLLSNSADPKHRNRLVALVEAGNQQTIEACPADSVDHMPCEDPRRNSQLSREMNFYRERHCPLPEETPLCLIPPPDGYKVPVQWPESLHKNFGMTSPTLKWISACFVFSLVEWVEWEEEDICPLSILNLSDPCPACFIARLPVPERDQFSLWLYEEIKDYATVQATISSDEGNENPTNPF